MKDQDYQLELGVFEGPLDLLLHLIDKNELNIYDVPIHLLAEQYVAYLESLEDLDMEIASEFLIVAAQLMYVKSKALLPQFPKENEESEEDLAEKLRLQLLEYRAFKKASFSFAEILEAKKYFSRAPGEMPVRSLDLDLQNPLYLLEAWKNFQSGEISLFEPEEIIAVEPFNIEEKMVEIEKEVYSQSDTTLSLVLLLGRQKGKVAWLVSILAILELVRLKKIHVNQSTPFSEIYLFKSQKEAY